MFGFLATLLCGGIIVKEDLHRGRITQENKARAIAKGEATYFDDGISKWRSVETNEIVVHRKTNYKDEDIGVKTHRVYKCIDHKKEWEDRVSKSVAEDNKKYAEEGKNVYMKRLPAWDYRDSKGNHLGYANIDNPLHSKHFYFL